MSFTVADLRAAANMGLDGLALSTTEAIAATNEAIGWLGDMAIHHKDATLTVAESDLRGAMPSDCIRVLEVGIIDEDGTSKYGVSVTIRGTYLYFSAAGQYSITYRALPGSVSAVTDFVPLHDIFKQPLVESLRSWALLKDDEESTYGMALRGQWMQDAARSFEQIRRFHSGPQSIKVSRDARSVMRARRRA